MTNKKQESLSALIDGEANELEVHRLVREFGEDDSLPHSWAIYLHVREVVRSFRSAQNEPHQGSTFGPAEHRLLRGRISAAIQQETTHQAAPARRIWTRRSAAIGGSLALAASLAVAVFIGVQSPEEQGETGGLVLQTNAWDGTQNGARNSTQIAGQAVDYQSLPFETPELIELDEAKQRRLRAYLNQHDRMARMNATLVNYESAPEK